MDILQLDHELRASKIRPCYVIAGPERFLALAARRQIVKAIFKDAPPTADFFQASKHSLGQILDCLRTPSMFALWRLVMVDEGEKFKKKDWEGLKKYLEGRSQKETLIVFSDSAKSDFHLPPAAAVIECKKLYPRQVLGWLNLEASHQKIPISREAASFLVDCVGTDLGELSQTLQKLSLFVGNQRLINLQDVEKAVARTAQKNLFDLTNAIGRRELKSALRQLEQILDQGEEPLKTLALIARHFRLLARAQELLAKSGIGEANIAKELKVHPFFAKDYVEQARRLSQGGWARRFQALYACDKSLKSSRHKPNLILEKLVRTLCAH